MFFETGCPNLLDDFVNLSLTVNNKRFSLRIYFSKGLNFPAVSLINSPKTYMKKILITIYWNSPKFKIINKQKNFLQIPCCLHFTYMLDFLLTDKKSQLSPLLPSNLPFWILTCIHYHITRGSYVLCAAIV